MPIFSRAREMSSSSFFSRCFDTSATSISPPSVCDAGASSEAFTDEERIEVATRRNSAR